MGTLLGEATTSVLSLPPFSRGSALKGNNLLPLEQILHFKSKALFVRASFKRKCSETIRMN